MTSKIRRSFWSLYRAVASDPYKIAQAWRNIGMQIGEGTAVYRNVHFGRGGTDPIVIGKNCVLTGCTILGHDASTNFALGLERSPRRQVVIEDHCFIGFGAIILLGVRVRSWALVRFTEDVPPVSVMAGNSDHVICTVEELVKKRQQQIQNSTLITN